MERLSEPVGVVTAADLATRVAAGPIAAEGVEAAGQPCV